MSPDGRRLVTAGRDHTARVFDTASGRPLQVLRGHGRPLATAVFAPQGERIVTASDDGTARMWDAADGRQLAVLRHEGGALNSAAFSPDGERVVTAGDDGTVRIWDVETQRQVAILRDHRAAVRRELRPAGHDGPDRRPRRNGPPLGAAFRWQPGSRQAREPASSSGLQRQRSQVAHRGRRDREGLGPGKRPHAQPAPRSRRSRSRSAPTAALSSPRPSTARRPSGTSETGARTTQLVGHGAVVGSPGRSAPTARLPPPPDWTTPRASGTPSGATSSRCSRARRKASAVWPSQRTAPRS